MLLDVPITAIEYDYKLTDKALEGDKEERLAEIREIGLTDDWGMTSKELISSVAQNIEVKYGGLAGYMDAIGFTETERKELRDALLY